MPTLDELDNQLTVAASLLDAATVATRMLAKYVTEESSERHRAIAQMVLDRNASIDGT